jgi:hypothetical protein
MSGTGVEEMNHEIARILIDEELARMQKASYQELLKSMDQTLCKRSKGPDGQNYQIETQVFWDGKKGGNIRVMVSVDDGGLAAAIKPLCGDFIISPDGR